MYNTNIPSGHDLPSSKKLFKSTLLAALVAGVLLVTVVMPAEYGLDPTGFGRVTGLKQMGEIKMSLAQEAAAEKKAAAEKAAPAPALLAQPSAPAADPAVNETAQGRSDETRFTLAPNEAAEIKVALQKGETVTYAWATEGGAANFDIHGDSKALKIDYHNYAKGKAAQKEGVLEAAFDGSHGWFWRNRTARPLIITLKTKGKYADIKRIK